MEHPVRAAQPGIDGVGERLQAALGLLHDLDPQQRLGLQQSVQVLGVQFQHLGTA